MAMSNEDIIARDFLVQDLGEKGYGTYAKLLTNYHLNITTDPNVAGFMEPATGRIVVNADLEIQEVELVIRHEIMHFWLKHAIRLRDKLAREKGIDRATADAMTLRDLENEVFSTEANIVMDYEISNETYDDDDKDIVRKMHALVTEDDHPGWETMTMEEMWDALKQWEIDNPPVVSGVFADETTFLGLDGKVYGA